MTTPSRGTDDADDRASGRNRTATLKTALTIAFIAAGSVYVASHAAEFRSVAWPSLSVSAAVVLGFIASVYLRSLYNYVVARRLGASLSQGESFMLSAVVTASNAILPANPGATFRAVYMKKAHAFPYGYFASSTLLSFIVTTLLMSLVAMAVLLMINRELGYFRLDLFVALPIIAVIASLGLLLRTRSTSEQQSTRGSMWQSFKAGYFSLVRDRRIVYTSILIAATNFLVASLVWVFVLRDFAPGTAVLEGLLFAASQIVSGLITLTPGAAGFQEVVGVYVGQSFALSAVELFAILLWVRLVRIVTAVLLALPCAIRLRALAR